MRTRPFDGNRNDDGNECRSPYIEQRYVKCMYNVSLPGYLSFVSQLNIGYDPMTASHQSQCLLCDRWIGICSSNYANFQYAFKVSVIITNGWSSSEYGVPHTVNGSRTDLPICNR